jgi:hypothetical protein
MEGEQGKKPFIIHEEEKVVLTDQEGDGRLKLEKVDSLCPDVR